MKCHWTIRVIITLFGIILAPVAIYIGLTIFILYSLMCSEYNDNCFMVINGYLYKFCCLFSIPFIIINVCVFLTLAIFLSTLAVVLGVVPFYLIVVILLFRLIYNWCLKSKKGALNKKY